MRRVKDGSKSRTELKLNQGPHIVMSDSNGEIVGIMNLTSILVLREYHYNVVEWSHRMARRGVWVWMILSVVNQSDVV